MEKKYKDKLDELFFWFENNEFKNEGNYPRNTNLVLEFSDYIDKLDDDDLVDKLELLADYKDPDDALKAAAAIRIEIENGIDRWLEP